MTTAIALQQIYEIVILLYSDKHLVDLGCVPEIHHFIFTVDERAMKRRL